MKAALLAFSAAILSMPSIASALTVPQLLGYFEIVMGLFVAISVVVFVGALIVYFIRLGTVHREDTFVYMYFSITTVFILSIILAVIKFLQTHTAITLYVIATIIFIIAATIIIRIASIKTEEKREEHR